MQQDRSTIHGYHKESAHLPLIYILGNSHSGSTLLGFLLSSNPHIINVGELKARSWLRNRLCSCSQPVNNCPLYKDYFTEFNTLKENIIMDGRKINPLRFLFQKKIYPGENNISLLRQFHTSLSEKVTSLYPEAKYMTDGSKSVWMLNNWLHTLPADQIKILWIQRNVNANVASFVKRGLPFIASLVKIKANNFIIKRFVKKNKLEHLVVNYDRFYLNYEDEAKAISLFLKTEVPPAFIDHENHHVISGNVGTRKSFRQEFKGFHQDDEWIRILSPLQKKILSWIS
ncbi:MAG TPA: hypothetical protein VGK46_09825 [Saprospiraceae bacterium]|jgi:hypothetical protein